MPPMEAGNLYGAGSLQYAASAQYAVNPQHVANPRGAVNSQHGVNPQYIADPQHGASLQYAANAPYAANPEYAASSQNAAHPRYDVNYEPYLTTSIQQHTASGALYMPATNPQQYPNGAYDNMAPQQYLGIGLRMANQPWYGPANSQNNSPSFTIGASWYNSAGDHAYSAAQPHTNSKAAGFAADGGFGKENCGDGPRYKGEGY